MSIERQAISAFKWASFAKLSGQLVTWASTLVVMRLLQPEAYGLMAMTSVVIALLGSTAELGMGAAVVQARYLDKQDLAKISGLVVVFNMAVFFLLLLSAPLIAWCYGEQQLTLLIQVAALQLPLSVLSILPQALAQRDLDFRFISWVEVAASVAAAAVTLALAYQGAGVWSLVAGSLVGIAVRALVLVRIGFIWPSFRFKGVGRFLKVGGAVTFARISWQFTYQSDVLIGAWRLGTDAIGVYSVSLHLASLPMQKIMGTLNQVILPAVARLQGEAERLRRHLLDGTKLMTVISIPLLWGISAVTEELVTLVLGEKWLAAIFPMQVIALSIPARMMTGIFATAAVGAGRVGVDVRNNILSALILPAGFLVGCNWGVNGLALSWLVSIPLLLVLNFGRMANALSIEVRDVVKALWRPAVAGIIMYGTVAATRAALADLDVALRLPALIAAGAAGYIVVLHVLDPAIWRDLRRLVQAARGGGATADLG